MLEIIKKIITNVLVALYQPFPFAVILSIFILFFYMFAKERGWKNLIKEWCEVFKTDVHFRRLFLLVFYTAMILFRTLLNRNMWANPVSNVLGVWGLYNSSGELTTEAPENLALFVPFMFLLLWCYQEKIVGPKLKFWVTIWQSAKISFLFSSAIEFLQLFLRLGDFQLSDFFYNTLGGVVGGLIYWAFYKISCKNYLEK